MLKKPSNLIYGVDEPPPVVTTFILGLQHFFIISVAFILPVVIGRTIGAGHEQIQSFVSLSMIGSGIGTILQGLRNRWVGSGYLCPSVCGPSYFSSSILAAQTGGLSLVCGMTMISGFFEALLSRIMHKLRPLFPAEVNGLVVMLVGISVVPLSVSNFLGIDGQDTVINSSELIVAFLSLAVMISLNIWGKGSLRLYCIIIGILTGYTVSILLGVLTGTHFSELEKATFLSFPQLGRIGWSFDIRLVLPFLIAMLCSSLKSVGDITTCQKINDVDWKRTDMKNVAGGILADAGGALASGMIGGMGQSTSSSNVGLSIASGAASRRIAYYAGGIAVTLAFFPKLSAFFAIMPKPVMGAALVFCVSFMIVAGVQIIMSRMIDARKTFVIGVSLIFGLSVDIHPEIYNGVYPWLKPVFSSSLSLGTVSAVILNIIFRIGIAKSGILIIKDGDDSYEKIFTFLEDRGSAWGARKEVVNKVRFSLNEILESLSVKKMINSDASIKVSFDEYNLYASLRYEGAPLELSGEKPDMDDLVADESSVIKLSGYMVTHYADKVRIEKDGSINKIRLYFEH